MNHVIPEHYIVIHIYVHIYAYIISIVQNLSADFFLGTLLCQYLHEAMNF